MSGRDLVRTVQWTHRLTFWFGVAPWMAIGAWLIVNSERHTSASAPNPWILLWLAFPGVLALVAAHVITRWLVSRLNVEQVRALIRHFGRPIPMGEAVACELILRRSLSKIKTRSDLSEAEWRTLTRAMASTSAQLRNKVDRLLRSHQIVEASAWLGDERERSELFRTVKALRAIQRAHPGNLPRFARQIPAPWRAEDFIGWAEFELQQLVKIATGGCSLAGLAFAAALPDLRPWIGLFILPLVLVFVSGSRDFEVPIAPPDEIEPDVLPTLLARREASRTRLSRWKSRRALSHAIRSINDFSSLREADWERLLLLLREKPKDDRVALLTALSEHAPTNLLPLVQEELARWLSSTEKVAPFRIEELNTIRVRMQLGRAREAGEVRSGE